jgi:hypothetical protein
VLEVGSLVAVEAQWHFICLLEIARTAASVRGDEPRVDHPAILVRAQ